MSSNPACIAIPQGGIIFTAKKRRMASDPGVFDLAGGTLLLATGTLGVIIWLLRPEKKDYTIPAMGVFFALYGLRWLLEVTFTENNGVSGWPDERWWAHSLLTYLISIPFAGFMLGLTGPGLFRSMFWFFISTIAYALFAIGHDLLTPGSPLTPSINTAVLALWCLACGINIILIDHHSRELKILKITIYLFIILLAYDNLVSLNLLPWSYRFEHIGILVLFAGMSYIAFRRLRNREEAFAGGT